MTDLSHLTESELARFVDNALTAEARARAIAHLDGCEACRNEVVVVGRVVGAGQRPVTSQGRLARSLTRVGAIAAVLAGLWLLPRLLRPEPDPPVRQALPEDDFSLIEALDPEQLGAAVRLSWRGNGADGYRVVILSEDGAPVWSVESADTTISVPAESGLRPGVGYFWRVDAVTEGVTASSGPRQLRLTPR